MVSHNIKNHSHIILDDSYLDSSKLMGLPNKLLVVYSFYFIEIYIDVIVILTDFFMCLHVRGVFNHFYSLNKTNLTSLHLLILPQ